jgi:hypothetical protein
VRALPRGHSLGAFTGRFLNKRIAAQRRKDGGHCILQVSETLWLDGFDVEPRSPLSFINSSQGTASPPNCRFDSDDETLIAVLTRDVAAGEELLADYVPSSAAVPAPPAQATEVDALELCARLKDAVLGAGAVQQHPLAWTRDTTGAPPLKVALDALNFGPFDTLAAVGLAFGLEQSLPTEEYVPAGVGEAAAATLASMVHSLLCLPEAADDSNLFSKALFEENVSAYVYATCGHKNFLPSRSAPVEFGSLFCGCLVIVLQGSVSLWASAPSMENFLLYAEDSLSDRDAYDGLEEAVVPTGGAVLIPAGRVWQLANSELGGMTVALCLDFPMPVAGWPVASSVAWLLSHDTNSEQQRLAARFFRRRSPQKALAELKNSYWGRVLGL